MAQKEKNIIDFAKLYGVRPGETDFSGAIKRTLETGPKHLSNEFIKLMLDKKHYKRRKF